jgi:hypothetical protein
MAGIAVGAALIAGSVAMLGFGLDSGIEAPASIIVIWRFTSNRPGDARLGREATLAASAVTHDILRPRAQPPAVPSQGNSGLRKITRSLSPDLATFGWTRHHRNVRKDKLRTSFLRIGRSRREPTAAFSFLILTGRFAILHS